MFQISHQRLEFLIRNELCRIPDLMNDTLLDLSIREKRLQSPVESLSGRLRMRSGYLLRHGFQSVQNGKPELCTLILPYIHAEHVFMPFHVDSDSDINRTFYNPAFITDMVMDSVHENDRIDFLKGRSCHSFTMGRILSVILLMVLSEISMS